MSNVQYEFKATRRTFDEEDMTTPISSFSDYEVREYGSLPNCLDVLDECAKVSFDGLTQVQYEAELLATARQLCRVELTLVDVDASYDLARFKLRGDSDITGHDRLQQADVNLSGYSRTMREVFSVSGIKEKGLNSLAAKIGDRIVLVGLGDIGNASLWGAMRRIPRGESLRHVEGVRKTE